MIQRHDLYISVDIETDGPIPFKNSMIDLGAAAFTLDDGIFASFSQAIEPILHGQTDPVTMSEFWNKHRERYEYLLVNGIHPNKAMLKFVEWAEDLAAAKRKKPIFAAYPAGYDFTWTYAYMMYFVGRSPFGFVALDFKSYTSGLLGIPYREAAKRNMPKSWFPDRKHTHNAVEDATEQAEIFINALKISERPDKKCPECSKDI